jgi:YVTN family beta-propeller protein
MKRRGRGHVLTTILFTDIVGSTRVAAELSDRRWRVLLDRHHAIVRKELKRFGARELDTAGDGFFAAFSEPSDAIRCACAIVEGVRALGIEVRAGLNHGEAEVIAGKLGGMAVHAAARIMSLAGPGEVLVASTIRDLVPGSGFTFADRGTHELRDIPGAWRLYAVTGADGTDVEGPLDPDVAAERRANIEPSPLLQRRGGRVLVGAVAIAVVAVGVTIPLTARRGSSPSPTPHPSPAPTSSVDQVVRIDPLTQEISAPIPVGKNPSAIAYGEGSTWVVNSGDNSVTRIDPVTRGTRDISVGASPHGIAVGSGYVWVTNDVDGTISKIDPSQNKVIDTIELGIGRGRFPMRIAADDETGAVWTITLSATQGGDDTFTIYRIEVASDHLIEVLTEKRTGVLAAGQGSVWFAGEAGLLLRLDARTGAEEHRSETVLYFLAATVGGGSAWLASGKPTLPGPRFLDGSIMAYDLTTNDVGVMVAVGGGPTGVAVVGAALFASVGPGGVVPYIGGSVQIPILLDGSATAIVAGGGGLWVAVDVP